MVMSLQALPSSRYLAHSMASSVSDVSLSTTAADEDEDEPAGHDILLPESRSLASLSMPMAGHPYGGPCDESGHGTPNSTSSYMLLDTSLHSTTSAAPHTGLAGALARARGGMQDDSSTPTSTLYHTDSSGCISSIMEAPQIIPTQTSRRLPPGATDDGAWAMDTTTEQDWPTWSEAPSTATSSSASDKQMIIAKPSLSPGGGAFARGCVDNSCISSPTGHSMMIDMPIAPATSAALTTVCGRVSSCAASSSHQQDREMFHFLEDFF